MAVCFSAANKYTLDSMLCLDCCYTFSVIHRLYTYGRTWRCFLFSGQQVHSGQHAWPHHPVGQEAGSVHHCERTQQDRRIQRGSQQGQYGSCLISILEVLSKIMNTKCTYNLWREPVWPGGKPLGW